MDKLPHLRTWELAKAQLWAITPEYLEVIAAIAAGHQDMAAYEALQNERGRPLQNAQGRVTLRGESENVAVMPITGPIFPRANLFTYFSGATSADILARDLRTALDNPTVDAIILEIDSPGGAVAGINELTDMIYQARQEKRIYAYAMHQMASAAYWIGSGAHAIVTERTGLLGSIGVVSRIEDSRARDERQGVRTYQVVSNVSPDKVLDPSQDESRAKIQKMVDDMAAVFVESVARNRGISMDAVIANFGRGGTMLGDHAVAAGLADRTGSLETLITELSAEGRAAHYRRTHFMARGPAIVSTTAELQTVLKAGHTADEISIKAIDTAALEAAARKAGADETTAALNATHATTLEAKTKEARDAGVKDERARIAGIHAIALPGFEAEAQKAVTDGSTPEQFALAQSQLQKDRGTSRLQQKKDAPGAIGHGGAGTVADDKPDQKAIADSWDKANERAAPRTGHSRKR